MRKLRISGEIEMNIKYDYLIIGGGIAGVTAAETIREINPGAAIGIVSDESSALYSRVLIPSYLKHRITRDQLFLRRAEDFIKKSIDFHFPQIVSAVDTRAKTVHLDQGAVFGYQKLLIASGGKIKPWGSEEDQPLIYRMQTLEDTDRLHTMLPSIQRPLVIGSSFISLEFLEVFFLNRIAPTLMSRDDYFFMRMLDAKGGELMQANFDRHGIRFYFQDSIRELNIKEKKVFAVTERLFEIPCDAIGVGIGLDPNVEFLKNSGIDLGEKGIKADEFLRTSAADVFVAGDVAEYFDVIQGKHIITGNWTNAFLQGKRAGLNMAGITEPYRNVPAYSITNLGLQITALGDCGKDAETVTRSGLAENQYERFFLRDGVLAGAVLINRFQDKPHLARLIEKKVPVGPYKSKLQDMTFDVREIAA